MKGLRPDLTPLSSTMLAGHSYDPQTRKLTVQYIDKEGRPGDVWEHEDVPMERAETLAGSMSPGRYFNENVRGQYRGRKVT